MDVINLSLGEPEVTPSRDLAARAINAAVDAGVVAAISAGNSFELFGRGTDLVARDRREGDHGGRRVGRRRARRLLLERPDAALARA